MATRIIPSYLASDRSVFEQPSGHGRHLLSDLESAGAVTAPRDLRDLRFNEDDDADDVDPDFVTDAAMEPAGDEKTVAAFLSLFPHRNESVIRYSDFTEWREVSRFHFLSDEEILSTLSLESKLKRGVRFDATTQLQVILIPFESPYQNIQSATLLKQQFKTSESQSSTTSTTMTGTSICSCLRLSIQEFCKRQFRRCFLRSDFHSPQARWLSAPLSLPCLYLCNPALPG